MSGKGLAKVTPSDVITGVDFSDEISAVKGQLTTKVALSRKVKESWAELSSFLSQHGCNMGYRRKDIDQLDGYVSSVTVYDTPKKVVPSKIERDMLEYGSRGNYAESFARSKDFNFLKQSQPKAAKLIEDMMNVYNNPTRQPDKTVNVEKTEKAREKARSLIRNYVDAVISSEENAEAMQTVGDYVDVVEKVAKIAGSGSSN